MTIEISQFKKLMAKVYLAFFIRHEVSQFMTFEEALPFVRRTVDRWTIQEFERFVTELELKNENFDRHSIRLHA